MYHYTSRESAKKILHEKKLRASSGGDVGIAVYLTDLPPNSAGLSRLQAHSIESGIKLEVCCLMCSVVRVCVCGGGSVLLRLSSKLFFRA